MASLIEVLEVVVVFDLIVSYTISEYVDLFENGLISYWFKVRLHGDPGYIFFNNQCLLSVKNAISHHFSFDIFYIKQKILDNKNFIC
jgi:hypothetical protein